jgi:signal transduction histidine kinase
MHLPRLDLRLRIAAALATVCIAVVGALGLTLYKASQDMEASFIEQLVTEELDSLVERTRDSGHAPPSGPNIQYYVATSPEQLEKLPAQMRTLAPGHHQIGNGADEKHVAVRDLGANRYIVVYDAGAHEVREARFKQLLYFAFGTIAAVSVILGYWLAGVLTRQLTDLAGRVARLHPDAPHAALERPDHDREVAALARALDEYQTRIVDMIQREQEFTSNASHELRTPLTAIRTSCELLMSEAALPQKVHARIEQIDSAARQMTERIEILLLLARSRVPEAVETVPLRRCVEDAAYPFLEEIESKNLDFDIAIPDSQLVEVDRKALQVVLSNLIKNAVRYTDRGHVRVTYEAPRVIVSDSGAGIAPEHQPQLFERYFRADNRPEGLGLGLAIVRRICDHFGWKIEVRSAPGRGSVFSVLLPPRRAL